MTQAKTNPVRARLDALARERGFPDYATWKAWNEKYRAPVQGKKSASSNFLQTLKNFVNPHPVAMAQKKLSAVMDRKP